MSVILLSMLGIFVNAWYLRNSGFDALAWNVLPYVLSGIPGVSSLSLKSKALSRVLLGAVAGMLLVDSWVYVETAIGSKSYLLLAVSLASTLKLFTVLPVGAIIGYIAHTWLEERK